MQQQLIRVHEAQAQKIELLDAKLLNTTSDPLRAFQTMIAKSGTTHEALGSRLKKPRETVTRMINGNAGITPDLLIDLIEECGNAYFLQFMAHRFGFELKPIDQRLQRMAELEAEMEELKRAVA
jgi:plasmid maintenance system antidote protein VapI